MAKQRVWFRAKGRCEVVLEELRCVQRAQDVHHVIKRSQGGLDDPDTNLIALCRGHHDQTDSPYYKGRLAITPSGGGTYVCRIYRKDSKWSG